MSDYFNRQIRIVEISSLHRLKKKRCFIKNMVFCMSFVRFLNKLLLK